MKNNQEISKCKKCNAEPSLKRHSTNLLVQVLCVCGNESTFECSCNDAISNWERNNKS
jgi:hypothetical protein